MKAKTRHYKHWYLLSLRGLILVMLGVVVISLTKNPITDFVKVFEAFAIVSGLLLIQSSLLNRSQPNWQFVLLNGMLDLSFGLLLYLIPEVNLLDLKILIAIWLLYSGLIQIVDSFVLIHNNVINWWFELFSGMISFLLAFLTLAARFKTQQNVLFLAGVIFILSGFFVFGASIVLKKPDNK